MDPVGGIPGAAVDGAVAPVSGCGLSRRSLARAHDFMEQNLGEALTLEDIARSACLSRSHFARMFRRSTGLSPMDYLMRLRIGHARLLLARDEFSIAQVSAATGFSHQSHFTRVFRRLVGITPRAFARAQAPELHKRDRSDPS